MRYNLFRVKFQTEYNQIRYLKKTKFFISLRIFSISFIWRFLFNYISFCVPKIKNYSNG